VVFITDIVCDNKIIAAMIKAIHQIIIHRLYLLHVFFKKFVSTKILPARIPFLFILTFLQINHQIEYKSWTIEPVWGSILIKSIIMSVIGLVSWLSNREIEKALKRAKKSELELKKERDGLEIEVQRRTEELKKAQLEKLTIFYRFANYGRMAAGLFHDIANPLTQVSLSLSRIEYQAKNKLFPELKEIEPIVKRAINGTKQMEKFMMMLKKQIQQQEMEKNYKPWEEIKMAIENFEYKARKMKVQMDVTHKKNIYTVGNSLRFYQMISNLISNALDSYHEIQREENRKILIRLDADKNEITITVKDFGCGMSKKVMKKIFDPWFTTKDPKRGTGVGLYMTKKIVEEEFKGKIEVKSKLNKGTLFTVKFPIKRKLDEKKY
jgi:signal transduction histidine kinase